MTLPTSYEENERESFFSDLISLKYFKNYFKKDRILMLIMTICVFIISPLITFFMYNNSYNSSSINNTVVSYNKVMYCITAVILGIVLPLYLYNYNHNRKSSIFFNSIPIKKHTLYNTHALLGLVYYLISVTINYIFVSLIIFANNPSIEIISYHFKSYLINLIIFVAIYCAMIFVANIAGTLLSSAILYVYMNFYICCWILIIYLAFEIVCSYTMFRMTGEMFFNTSFIMYTISKLESMNLLHALLILATGAVLYFCGIILNRKQKTEKAERSIYFERFEQIFKYSMLAVVIITAGMAFYSSGGGGFGYYIGSAFGGIVGLIIMNIITRKNIKESFYKFKNLVVFFVIVTLISIPVVGILKFLDAYVPDANSIAYVENKSYNSNNLYYFSFYGNFYEWSNKTGQYNYATSLFDYGRSSRIKDKSAIEAVTVMQDIYKQNKYNNNDYSISNTYRLSSFMNDFDYKFNNGYRLSKSMRFYTEKLYEIFSSSEYKNAFYQLNSSEDYIKSTFYPLVDDKTMEIIYAQSSNISVSVNSDRYDEKYEEYYSIGKDFFSADKTAKLIEALKKDITAIASDKQKFLTVYEGVLENNKQIPTTEYDEYGNSYSTYSYSQPASNGSFNEYRLHISFYNAKNYGITLEITINDYFTETLRFINENLK